MLDELIVRNLGIIQEARIEPGPGLTVITGETGTGKTLLLGALRLLLGGAARSDLIGPYGDEASAEGRFVGVDGMEIAAGRRLTAAGRSRAYIDGSIASAAALDDVTDGLVEIVAQHDQLAITRPAEIRAAVDRMLSKPGSATLEAYRDAWRRRRRLTDTQRELGGDRPALERERDLTSHQAGEIEGAGFVPGDEADLDRLLARLRNAETLRLHLAAAADSLKESRDTLGAAITEIRRASAIDSELSELSGEIEVIEAQMGEVAIGLGDQFDGIDTDESQLADAESRFKELTDLKRKYGSTLEEVLEFGEQAKHRSAELVHLLDSADTLGAELDQVDAELGRLGAELTGHRRKAADRMAGEAAGHLRELGFSDPVVAFEITPSEPSASGADSITLEFASDARLTPGPIARVASGGELSRLVLALRLAGGAGDAESLVFDEIDAGVGGTTALSVGRKLASLAADRQVLCVTHLPQVAAFADRHYTISRDDSGVTIVAVDSDRRLEELSRMLAGLPDSDRGREAAEELVELARTARAP